MKCRIFYDRHLHIEDENQRYRWKFEHDTYSQCVQFLIHLLLITRQFVHIFEDEKIFDRCVHESSHSAWRFQSSSFFLRWFVEIDAACSSEWAFKHNKKARSDIDVIQEIYHVRKSHNCKHHRFHVYDDSFDRQIKTLHDEIWLESIIESHIDFDSHILRNRIELISNFSKSVKIDRFEKDQKSWKKRADSVTFVIDSRDRWIRVWNLKISAINDEEDRILSDIQSIRQILLNQRMWWCNQEHSLI